MRHPRAFARTFLAAAAIALFCAAPAGRAETISPDSWVYDALRSFEVRGLVRLEPTLPYTFDECERYVRAIASAVERERIALGPRHRFLLDRLEREFVGKGSGPEERYDAPVAVVREGERWVAFDATIGGACVKKLEDLPFGRDEDRGEANGLATPGLLVNLGRRLTLQTEYQLVLGPERGERGDGLKPSPRTRSFRGLTGEFTRGLVSMNGEWWDIRAGREYIHWGGSRTDGLTVSRAAGSFDHFGGSLDIGRFTLSAFYALLDPYWNRHLAGHRLTIELPRGVFLGIGETVVYGLRDFDWMYLTPVGFWYAHQFSEGLGNEDNVVWEIDWKVPVARRVLLYGEFLVDDIQYERGDDAGPDRLGFDVAAEGLLMVAGREIEIAAGYTRINAYTYGHWHVSEYTNGRMNMGYGNPLIGGQTLGPDADRLYGSASIGISGRMAAGARGSYERYGALGKRFSSGPREWYPGMDSDPCFPSGPVLTETHLSGTLRCDLGGGSLVWGEAGVRWGDIDGRFDERDGFCRVELALDL